MQREETREAFLGGGPSLREDSKKEKLMIVGTLNVKNLETNGAFVSELLERYDILALQEHWLFNYQLPEIEKKFNKHSAHSRAIDEATHYFLYRNQEAIVGLLFFIRRKNKYENKEVTTWRK